MPQTIGSTIRSLRKQRNLTREELAQLLDVSNDTVLRWETDSTAPELSLIPKLALHLHADPEVLTGGILRTGQKAGVTVSNSMLLSIILSAISIPAAAILNWAGLPLPGFLCGSVLIAIGIPIAFRCPSRRWVLFAAPVLFSILLPLVLCNPTNSALPALRWLTYGAAFAAITAIACAAVYYIFLSDRKKIGDTLRYYVRHGLILLTILITLGLLHFFLLHFLTNSQLLYSDSVTFYNWDDFRNYMQTPLSSDGKNNMVLLSIEESENNLLYRFSDPNNGTIEIRDAMQTIPDPLGGEDLCTYLNLNQFVYRFSLSSQGNLPVQIITNAELLQAQQVHRTVHIVFILLYFAAAGIFIFVHYMKTV